MCGIAGIVNFAGKAIDRQRLAAMARSLAHRGPDDHGIWTGKLAGASVGLVHRRLAIIDLSPAAAQPMFNTSGRLVLVFNGEIYNFLELRSLLAGTFAFRTRSDAETIIAAYDRWGPQAWQHLRGMFALALADLHEGDLWLVRDRFGIKPLWYVRTPEELLFASELAALLSGLQQRPEVDPDGLAQYLLLGTTISPETVIRNVCKVKPGQVLRVSSLGKVTAEQWHMPLNGQAGEEAGGRDLGSAQQDLQAAAAQWKELLIEAVREHLIADVPVGVLLSGGVDSSVVAAAAAKASGGGLQTFSVGFADQPAYDESRYAQAVAWRLGTEHRCLLLGLQEVSSALPDLLDALDEPFGDSSYIPATMLAALIRRHVKAALSGDGGDELFAGYWRYLAQRAWPVVAFLPDAARKSIAKILEFLPTGRASGWPNRVRQIRKLLAARGPDAIGRHLDWAQIVGTDLVGRLLQNPSLAARARERTETHYRDLAGQLLQRSPGRTPLEGILSADLLTFLPDDMLHKIDRASMRCSLEVRVPLLDHRLVEFTLQLPLKFKLHGFERKRLLRLAFRDDLPEFVFKRPKMGFEVPVCEFLRKEWYDAVRECFSCGNLARCGVDEQQAISLLEQHRTGRYDHSQILFSLLTLAWWSGRYL